MSSGLGSLPFDCVCYLFVETRQTCSWHCGKVDTTKINVVSEAHPVSSDRNMHTYSFIHYLEHYNANTSETKDLPLHIVHTHTCTFSFASPYESAGLCTCMSFLFTLQHFINATLVSLASFFSVILWLFNLCIVFYSYVLNLCERIHRVSISLYGVTDCWILKFSHLLDYSYLCVYKIVRNARGGLVIYRAKKIILSFPVCCWGLFGEILIDFSK